MELLDAAVARARSSVQRRNNAFRLRASTRCRKFLGVIDRCIAARKEFTSVFSLTNISDAIQHRVDSEPDKAVYGDILFNNIVKTINGYKNGDGTPYSLRLDQQKMVAFILSACLPMIYRNDLEVHKDRILGILKAPDIYELLLILASRRVGKTTCIASVAAALIICIPEIKLTIFANVKKASVRVMNMITSFLRKDPRGIAYLNNPNKIMNQDTMVVRDPTADSEKALEVYAATTNVRLSSHSFSLFFHSFSPFAWYVLCLFLSPHQSIRMTSLLKFEEVRRKTFPVRRSTTK
ncbi:MAG: hypothetical protein BVN35_17765 [Proteobacteria bacterium ST_bin11]|nr:MAG: hypothetical protein BVN35_17765 [Proteobacteria bacterium ST_bin11]